MRNRHIRRGTSEAQRLGCSCVFIAIDRRGAESFLGWSETGPGWCCALHATLAHCKSAGVEPREPVTVGGE